jgi:fumarate reductase subunit C
MKTKIIFALVYILVEIALLYGVMSYFGYGDFTYRPQVLIWAVISSVVISLALTLVFLIPKNSERKKA